MISDETLETARLLYEGAIESPFRESLKGLLATRDWATLAEAKVKPGDYGDAEAYWSDNLISSFLRKNEALDAKIDLKAKALKSFLDAEHHCFLTNKRLYALRHNFGQAKVDVAAFSILERVRKIIREIVGHRPRACARSLSAGEIPAYCDLAAHGPGATLSDPSLLCTAPDKFESVPTMTEGLDPLLADWLSTKWAKCGTFNVLSTRTQPATSLTRLSRALKIVRAGKFFTVHKHALARRICEKQPNVNVWYQKGIGAELRRLFRPYVDLINAKSLHGELARYASVLKHLCTLDLEQASDTVACELVYSAWPQAWCDHFDMTRTKFTELPDGRVIRLEKFSSMGNGFTFELESITFFAICLAASGFDSVRGDSFNREIRGRFSVLGDDLIVPAEHSSEVIAALKYFGFKLNSEKSFVDGPFRESCGSDFYDGVPVRGFFLEKSIENPADIIGCLNGLRRTALAGGDTDSRWRTVSKAWHYLLGRLPRDLRSLFGPESLGDLVIHAPEAKWRSRTVNSIREFRAYKASKFTEFDLELYWNSEVVLASKLYGVSTEDPKGSGATFIRPRGDPLEYCIAWVACS